MFPNARLEPVVFCYGWASYLGDITRFEVVCEVWGKSCASTKVSAARLQISRNGTESAGAEALRHRCTLPQLHFPNPLLLQCVGHGQSSSPSPKACGCTLA